ncbi:ARS-binding factor 1 [Phytophthora pseudosyringae]|uniref:ARS-binding factor 1 n=1 Tax=Phytophthora pseudosyringae TaxID=221518 RepID=A0A8T1V8T3_9STRA|nr:ARS-binding factor 1 [Phytophthora pseudosyringae]
MRPRAGISSGGAMARLADYFVEVVAEPAEQQQCEDFERRIVTRIPSSDQPDFALPDGVPYFCIPESEAFFNPSVYQRKPTFFSFILTGGDGVHAYGFALHFFEKYTTAASGWRPRVLCLISHHPFFSLFKEIVSWMYRSRYFKTEDSLVQTKIAYACEDCSWFLSPRHAALALPVQEGQNFSSSRGPTGQIRTSTPGWKGDPETNSIQVREQYYHVLPQLLRNASRPLPGRSLNIRMHGRDFFRYHVQRGKAVHLDDYCFQMLFQCLSLKNVIYIVNCLLLEQRVLVHSSHQGLLTPICEALCALLFPFGWKHVFIPFLPVKLIEYLQAPVPYFIGLHTSSLATRVGAEMFASCVVVHLDKDKVVSPIFSRVDDYSVDFALSRLPSKEVTALIGSLEGTVPNPIGHTPPARTNVHTPESPQHDSNTVNEVELTFGEGPLGITFESTHLRLLAASNFDPERQLGGSAVVKALPRRHNGQLGPAERSGLISAGSYLIGINGQSTLDLTFEETIDYLRRASRPVRLRFLNATLPYENACHFAERLQALSLVSALQAAHENQLLPWVDTLRGAFAAMFASIFCDYHRYIDVHRQESDTIDSSGRQHALPTPEQYGRLRRRSSALAFVVQFDYNSFCSAVPSNQRFLREFTQAQCFADFINESVVGTVASRPRGAATPLELFQECMHLIRESNNGRAAVMLLFERDGSPVESTVLDLPMTPTEGTSESSCVAGGLGGFNSSASSKDDAGCSSQSNPIEMRSSFDRTSASSAGEVPPCESPYSSSPSSPLEGKVNPLAIAEQPESGSPELDNPRAAKTILQDN